MNVNTGARLAALACCIAIAGCSGLPGGGDSSGGSFTERVRNSVLGAPATGAAPREPETLDCPPIDIRQGASTYTVYGTGEQNSTNVRYQGTVAETARECGFLGSNITMKVGIQGRVLIGPAGGPGRVEVPLRIAVVKEGPTPVTVWTKVYRVPVDVSGVQTTFEHIEPGITFPRPPGADFENYVIYAGYDPQAAGTKAGPGPSKKSRRARRAR